MKKATRIQLCEDDPNLGTLLSEYLKAKGFETTLATDGAEGLKQFKRQTFDFLVLDVMMPVKDGFTWAEDVRQLDRHVPILFLTAKSMKEDTLKGFKVGGDDYMTKPFSMEELTARVTTILKRSAALPDQSDDEIMFEIGEYSFNYNSQKLKHKNEEASKLTTKENELLYLLCKHKNGLLERNYALNAIWGDDNYFNGRSMDVYIAKLRKHLKHDPSVEIINVHGSGFKLLAK